MATRQVLHQAVLPARRGAAPAGPVLDLTAAGPAAGWVAPSASAAGRAAEEAPRGPHASVPHLTEWRPGGVSRRLRTAQVLVVGVLAAAAGAGIASGESEELAVARDGARAAQVAEQEASARAQEGWAAADAARADLQRATAAQAAAEARATEAEQRLAAAQAAPAKTSAKSGAGRG
ncbi:hypothetical protein [Quadrisphaera sp. DSM 44207]|uniref:hypothetical protein n=1 Tax=Quadrisphaera sp. DSM 44207 TaxID=1881057 RepID=UPI0008909A76|nr:hypothetical protein [Quadrisphaera sp. DSM 44207]SDQ37055.1 hypothetical protein SAMN05428996_1437 [Quadrisphaera sp. DSM 44207]